MKIWQITQRVSRKRNPENFLIFWTRLNMIIMDFASKNHRWWYSRNVANKGLWWAPEHWFTSITSFTLFKKLNTDFMSVSYLTPICGSILSFKILSFSWSLSTLKFGHFSWQFNTNHNMVGCSDVGEKSMLVTKFLNLGEAYVTYGMLHKNKKWNI